MKVSQRVLSLAVVLIALSTGSAWAIYESNCPQVCTPSCPCSLACQGPFGPTTCGQAGQACTNYAVDPSVESDVLFAAPTFLTADTHGAVEQPTDSTTQADEGSGEQAATETESPTRAESVDP